MEEITSNCLVEIDRKNKAIYIGDDIDMNGLDAPARIWHREDLERLINYLRHAADELGME